MLHFNKSFDKFTLKREILYVFKDVLKNNLNSTFPLKTVATFPSYKASWLRESIKVSRLRSKVI